MNDERWKRIERVLDAVLARDLAETRGDLIELLEPFGDTATAMRLRREAATHDSASLRPPGS